MKFIINQWVALPEDGAIYIGRVKKISIEEEGVKVFVAFAPGGKWMQFEEKELVPSGVFIDPPESGEVV